MKKLSIIIFCLGSLVAAAQFDKEKQVVIKDLDKNFAKYTEVAQEIWTHAELGFLEGKSTETLTNLLSKEGFKIKIVS